MDTLIDSGECFMLNPLTDRQPMKYFHTFLWVVPFATFENYLGS